MQGGNLWSRLWAKDELVPEDGKPASIHGEVYLSLLDMISFSMSDAI